MDPEVLPKDRDFHAELSLEATKGSLQCSGSNRTPQHCTLGGPTSWQEWSASRSLSGDAESPFDLLHADLSVSPKQLESRFLPAVTSTFAISTCNCDGSESPGMGGFSLAYFFKPSQPWFDVPTTKDKNNIVLGRGSSTMPPNDYFKGGGEARWLDFTWSDVLPLGEPR